MNHTSIWAPWRMAYIRDLERKAKDAGWDNTSGGNFLTTYFAQSEADEANHVIYRDEQGMVLLNRFPYANGHLLVALGEPRPRLLDYEPEQRAAFWLLIEIATELVQNTLHPQGINMGINEGRAAGAGVPEHLHGHVIPRWGGDTNFMSVVGGVRVIPDALETMAARFREVALAMGDQP